MARGVKTGGRQKGTLNKSTGAVKALAEKHGPAAIEELARIARESENEATRVSAIKELLDRAYGRASQKIQHSGDEDVPPVVHIDVRHVSSPNSK